MFNTFVRWQFQRTYDAMLAAPVDAEELITAEVLWISVRAGVYGMAPLLVGVAFGLELAWGMLLVPLIGVLTGFGFACFGVAIAAVAKTIDNFNYVTSAVLTPMFLVAGTFFPISTLPAGLRTIAELNPLYHCVQLVRDASFGELSTADLGHTAFLIPSLRPSGVMTVAKPPLALWVQAISVRVFGYHQLSVLVPQALMGVASVALVYDLVRRRFGRLGGFVGALALALTPMTVAIS